MDENTEDTECSMPKLERLMSDDEPSLFDILRNAPHRPDVVIRITVTNEQTGEVVENVHVESAELWEHYRTSYKTKVIRDTAEHVATRIAVTDENTYDGRFKR